MPKSGEPRSRKTSQESTSTHHPSAEQKPKQAETAAAENINASPEASFSPDASLQAADPQRQLADHLRDQGGDKASNFVLRLQSQYGNAYTNQVIQLARAPQTEVSKAVDAAPSIQREPPVAAPPVAARTWNAPLGLKVANNRAEAIDRLNSVIDLMIGARDTATDPLAETAISVIDSARTMAEKLSSEKNSDPALSTDDVNSLDILSGYAQKNYDTITTTMRDVIVQQISNFFKDPVDTEAVEADIRQALQNSFENNTSDHSKIKDLASSLDKLKEYKETVDKVHGWAEDVNKIAANPAAKDFLAAFKKGSDKIGKGLKYIRQVVTIAEDIQKIVGDSGGVATASDDVNKMRLALDGVDLLMNFASAVPVVGQLWSSYYGPVTRACLNLIEKIAKVDRQTMRDITNTFPTLPKGPDGVPDISKLNNATHLFPGGQPVFSFMYLVANGGSPAVTPAVEKFFIEFRERFDAAVKDEEAIKTESKSHWYNPFSWGDKGAPNLLPWVQAHIDTVWPQLYGNLPRTV